MQLSLNKRTQPGTEIVFAFSITVRLLAHVHCTPPHLYFQLFKATISNPLQTSFSRVMIDPINALYDLPPRGHLQG